MPKPEDELPWLRALDDDFETPQKEYEERHISLQTVVVSTIFMVLLEFGLLRIGIPIMINTHTEAGLFGVIVLLMAAILFPWIYYVKILRPYIVNHVKEKKE